MDYVCIHGALSRVSYELVKKEVLCYCTPKFFGTNYRLKENQALAGKKVGVFCGIGSPQAFIDGLKGLNVIIVKSKILADHEKCNQVEDFARECKALGAENLVCTAKDYVKLSDQEKKFVIPIEISMEVDFDGDVYPLLLNEFNTLIEHYKQQVKEKL
jgi:tetraacyldisaccharide-1-P 4'-kinase